MQNINIKCAADAAELEERREIDHGTHLMVCYKAYWKQARAGRHAHIEHPEPSRAWKTRAFSALPGYAALFDQCEYGATTINNDGFEEPIKKSTRTQTTKMATFKLMNRRCQGDHSHCPLEASMPGGGHRCCEAENYGVVLAKYLAKALMDIEDLTEQIYAADDAETGTVRKQGSEKVKEAIESLNCPHCQNYGIKKGVPPASVDRAENFNQVVQADAMWLELGKKRVAILSMVGECTQCTRYMAARIVSDEKPPSPIKAMERSWIGFHGPMRQLKVDEYAGWGSSAFATWAENHDIEKISPGEAHTRTCVVERRHQLLRRAIQIYMDDNEISGVDAVHEALVWVVPSLNEHTFVNGFTPTQLAMGRQPAIPGLMSEERAKPPQLSEGQHLQEVLRCRSQAQQACAKADVDARLRRAMLR
eukprot:s20_g38.t1